MVSLVSDVTQGRQNIYKVLKGKRLFNALYRINTGVLGNPKSVLKGEGARK
jgi:hypothetical protein